MSTQEEKILNQIEFYFSDSNLPNDRYLRSLVADHPEGYVEIKIIASFTRLKNLTTDLTEIVKAIKQSKVLECDKDEKFVRRVTPLPEDPDNDQRTVSLVGVDKSSTIDSITNAYSKYGKILCVRVYKDKKTHEPNGIASIEFSTVDEAKKFCEMKFDGIEIKSKQNFFEEKKKALKENKQKAQTEKKMKEINELKEKYKYTEGSLVKITNIGREKEVTFNEFNELVKSKAEVNYVDFPLFTVDPTTAIIRSKGIDESKKLLEAFKDQKLGGSEKECTIEIMKEEDVENYLIQVVEQNKKKLNQKGGKKGQRGGKKGGRGQKRKNDKGGDDRKNKKQKNRRRRW